MQEIIKLKTTLKNFIETVTTQAERKKSNTLIKMIDKH